MERRSKPRIERAIPATVRGTDAGGHSFELATTLDNLSVGGLHACVNRRVEAGTPLLAVIRLAGMEVKARGEVKRVECPPDRSFGLGVAFSGYSVHSS